MPWWAAVIWLFALGVLAMAVYHAGFRRVLLWAVLISALVLAVATMAAS